MDRAKLLVAWTGVHVYTFDGGRVTRFTSYGSAEYHQFWAGTPPPAAEPAPGPAAGTRALVLLASSARGEAAQVAAAVLAGGPDPGPRNHQSLLGATYGAQLAAAFGAVPAARHLYEVLLPFADQTVVSGAAITFRGAVAPGEPVGGGGQR